MKFLIKISSESNDIQNMKLYEYTNFTTSYLNQSTVVWNLLDKGNIFMTKPNLYIIYQMKDIMALK